MRRGALLSWLGRAAEPNRALPLRPRETEAQASLCEEAKCWLSDLPSSIASPTTQTSVGPALHCGRSNWGTPVAASQQLPTGDRRN